MNTNKFVAFFVAVLVFGAAGFAQENHPEIWLGELDVKVAKLRLEVRLSFDEDGNSSAKLISLDQNNAEINVDEFEIDGQKVDMAINQVNAKFSGQVSEDRSEWNGTFTQAGKEFPLIFKRVEQVPEREHVATWIGTLEAGGQEFEFQLRVFEEGDLKSAVLDSFSESMMGLATEFRQQNEEFQFEVPISEGKFVGELNEDKNKVDGKWIQRGSEFDLSFESIPVAETKSAVVRRPQTPNVPFPYDTVELSIEIKEAGLVLAGTLSTPRSEGPFPTVILVSGSGPQDRDETILGHKPFLVLADHLTRSGFAVFRYDERGVGESTGVYQGATTEDFASDAEAIYQSLLDNPLVDKENFGIIGHSEGGLVAPMIAARNSDVAFVVLMAGPGVTGKKILLTQSREIAAVAGASAEALDLNEGILTMILDRISPENEEGNLVERAIEEFRKTLDEEQLKQFGTPDLAPAQFEQFETPWFKFFNVYDPAPALEKVKCGVLSIIGEKDLQVDCEINQAAIEAALKTGGNENFSIINLPELNHLFQKCETGSPGEYSRIEETLNPKFLETVTDWLLEQVN